MRLKDFAKLADAPQLQNVTASLVENDSTVKF